MAGNQAINEEPEMSDLATQLYPVKAKWRAIGEQLGIEGYELDSIGRDQSLDDSDKLSRVCQFWKDKRTTEVSWRKILEVIRYPPIENAKVCKQIELFLGIIQPSQMSSLETNQPTRTEPQDNSNLKFPVPPSVKKDDYPLIQRMHTTLPIQYSEAGELVKDVNVILVTATDAEFRAVMGQAKPVGTENAEYHTIKLEDHTTFYLATYGKNKVAIIKTDEGAQETRRVLDIVQITLQAQYVIAVGICYGLKNRKIKLGDVIVSRRIVCVSTDISDILNNRRTQKGGIVFHQKENKAGTLYDLFRMSAGFELHSSYEPEDLVDIKPGAIIGDSILVADQKYKDQILQQTRYALGGEMEGAGIMELAGASHFQWIVIKSVADWGDGNEEICRKWQPFAAVAAAKYVRFHLDRNELKVSTKQSMLPWSSFGEITDFLQPLHEYYDEGASQQTSQLSSGESGPMKSTTIQKEEKSQTLKQRRTNQVNTQDTPGDSDINQSEDESPSASSTEVSGSTPSLKTTSTSGTCYKSVIISLFVAGVFVLIACIYLVYTNYDKESMSNTDSSTDSMFKTLAIGIAIIELIVLVLLLYCYYKHGSKESMSNTDSKFSIFKKLAIGIAIIGLIVLIFLLSYCYYTYETLIVFALPVILPIVGYIWLH